MKVSLKRGRPEDSVEEKQVRVTALNSRRRDNAQPSNSNEKPPFGSIFDRNKELTGRKNHATDSLCDDNNRERQQFDCIFERNRDLASTSQHVSEKKFSFVDSATKYFSTAKRSKLVLNPFVTSNLQKEALSPGTSTTISPLFSDPAPFFNGFEPDVKTTRKQQTVSSIHPIPNNVGDLQVFLRNALSRIHACNRIDVTEIWNELQKKQQSFDQKPNELTHNTIQALYSQLHTVLFGTHRFLGGSDSVATLKNWKQSIHRESNKKASLPKYVLDDIGVAYDYIFGNSRRDVNYQELINIVQQRMRRNNDMIQEVEQSYKFFIDNSSGNEFKKLHTLYNHIKSNKHNVSKQIKAFRKSYHTFRRSFSRNKTKTCKEND